MKKYKIMFEVNTLDGKTYLCETESEYQMQNDFIRDSFKNTVVGAMNLTSFMTIDGSAVTVFTDKICSIKFCLPEGWKL
jgi:hypothetical protein